jgi:hypothetical protein
MAALPIETLKKSLLAMLCWLQTALLTQSITLLESCE